MDEVRIAGLMGLRMDGPAAYLLALGACNFELHSFFMAFLDRATFLRYEPLLRDRSAAFDRAPVLLRSNNLTVAYAPIHYVNTAAQVLIVGITPGAHQANIAIEACSQALQNGASRNEACRLAKYSASFAGPMRANLIEMLDELGVGNRLGLATAAELFGDAQDLLDTASVLPYPVYVDGRNYTGHHPALDERSELWKFTILFLRQLRMLDRPLVVPLGRTVSDVVRAVAPETPHCLFGFPHPSPANGHRRRHFETARALLEQQVTGWNPRRGQRLTER